MGAQSTKQTFSLSLTAEERSAWSERAKYHGFGRNEYALALLEADIALGLEPVLVGKKKVLRAPSGKTEMADAAGIAAEAKKRTSGRS